MLVNIEIYGKTIKIKQGEFVVIYGHSGSGKSTILKDYIMSNDNDKVCFLDRDDDINHLQNKLGAATTVAPLHNVLKAVLGYPDVYLFDEPTSPILNTQVRKDQLQVLALIKQLHDSGKTVIMVTHDGAAVELGTRVIELSEHKTFIEHGPGLHHLL